MEYEVREEVSERVMRVVLEQVSGFLRVVVVGGWVVGGLGVAKGNVLLISFWLLLCTYKCLLIAHAFTSKAKRTSRSLR